jgi:fermentation-respiration switch protein FrsA (DUF1100 family)
MQIFKKMLWTIILVYIGYGAYLFVAQKSIIYYPDFPVKSDFYDCPAFEDTEKVDMSGTRAYYKHVGERIVVVYHGNAGSACDRDYLKSIFEDAGYSYLFVEYAGYGGEGKKPSRKLLLEDAENVVSFLKTKNYKETILFTESIGAGVASHHASLLSPDKMLFIAPFDSLANVAKSHFPFNLYPTILLTKLSKENYDNVPLLQKYKGELVVIHGTKDSIIPMKHGKALYDKVPTLNKKFIAIEGAGHNDIYSFDALWSAIIDFLK